MGKRTLSAEVAFLYHLLGIIPCAAGIGHEHGEGEPARQSANEQSQHTGNTQHTANDDRNGDSQERRYNHFVLGGTCGYLYARTIVGRACTFKYALDLTELSAHLFHHLLGGTSHSLHCESTEQEGGHGADEGTYQHARVHQVHLEVVHEVGYGSVDSVNLLTGQVHDDIARAVHRNLHLLDIGSQQGQGREGGRTNGEALTGSGGGVTKSIECIRTVAHLFTQLTHLSVTACIVGNRTVGIRSQGDTQRREHTHGSNTDTIKTLRQGAGIHVHHKTIGAEITQHDGNTDGDHGDAG